jgi:hypothetical protein
MIRALHKKWFLALACLWLAAGGAFAGSSHSGVGEYQVKAALIFNFTKFIEWPTNAFTAEDTPFVIGIVGEDPFRGALDEALSREFVGKRPIKIERLSSEADMSHCQMLFVSRSEKARAAEILSKVQNKPILTISETEGFGKMGGMVNFTMADKTVQFELNAGAAQSAGVKISSKLLHLPKATIVETRKEPASNP